MIIKKKKLVIDFLVILLFVIISIVYTYPLIFKMRSSFFGDAQWTFDTKASIYSIWLTRYQWLNKLPFTLNPLISFPFGADLSFVPSQWGLRVPLLILSLWRDEIFSFNIFILSSYVLAAYFTYLLVAHITGSRAAGVISGLIYSFAPYHALKAFSHLGLAATQWIPLYVLFLILLEERRSYSAAAGCGISFAVAALSSYYYGYMCVIITVVFLAVKTLYKKDFGAKWYVLALVFSLVLIVPSIFNEIKSAMFSKGHVDAGYIRPYYDLFRYSADVSDYFRPSEYHPIFGKIDFWFIKPYAAASRHWSERTVYLGFAPFLLGVYGMFKGKIKDKILGKYYFIFAAAAAFLLSMPPEIKISGMSIYLPNYFMYKVFPMFRCPARFGLIVILCISVLAGVGIKKIMSSLILKINKAFVVLGVIFIVLFEFTVIPPFRNVDLAATPDVYKYIKEIAGDKVIIEYPFLSNAEPMHNDAYLFYQRIHQKKLVNGAPTELLRDKFGNGCKDVTDEETVKVLMGMGVDYLVVHKDFYSLDELKKIKGNQKLILEKEYTDSVIYKLLK